MLFFVVAAEVAQGSRRIAAFFVGSDPAAVESHAEVCCVGSATLHLAPVAVLRQQEAFLINLALTIMTVVPGTGLAVVTMMTLMTRAVGISLVFGSVRLHSATTPYGNRASIDN